MDQPGVHSPVEAQRRRLKFEELVHQSAPDGHCRIGVRLEWDGRMIEEWAEGIETHHGRLRACADACLHAALTATEKRVRLDLLGVKAIRAFDGWVVVARVNGVADGEAYKLLGSASCEDDARISHAAVQAVLDATNRLLERYVTPPE